MLTSKNLQEIRDRLNNTTQGDWKIDGVMVKNGILNVLGSWPEKDDFANMDFIVSCREDLKNLLSHLEKCEMLNKELKVAIEMLEITIEKQAKIISKLEKNIAPAL